MPTSSKIRATAGWLLEKHQAIGRRCFPSSEASAISAGLPARHWYDALAIPTMKLKYHFAPNDAALILSPISCKVRISSSTATRGVRIIKRWLSPIKTARSEHNTELFTPRDKTETASSPRNGAAEILSMQRTVTARNLRKEIMSALRCFYIRPKPSFHQC